MAQEWYLMNTDNDTVSGFESDDFINTAQDAFVETLNSAIGVDVELCNYDLSKRVSQRVIIEGKVQDTKLKSMTRTMLCKIGECQDKQYVFYKNRYWLITGLADDNGIYEKVVLILCNYLLTWKNSKGKIIQRWINATSASQYNNGETSDKFTFVRSDQLMILIPRDDECMLIPHKQRFIIDTRCSLYEKGFAENTTVDTSKPLITYELTRMDNVLFNYQNGGHLEFMAYQDEQHETDGYYVVDGKGYWLCNEPSLKKDDDKTRILSSNILYDEPIIYAGLEPSVFMAKFYDSEGNEVQAIPQWEINCDFSDSLIIEYVDNSICISVNNFKLINKSFELSLSAENYSETSITVEIKSFI